MADVRLTLFDVATGKRIGETTVPVGSLPETFARETTMHIGGAEWRVMAADPETREACEATGRLRLELAKIVKLPPQEILYSLPSIENALPPLADGDVRGAARIHEDDWRQCEVVAPGFGPIIEAERVIIRGMFAERQGVGFARIHVRERIPAPLEGISIPLAAVARGERRDLAIGAYVVTGGFAYEHDGVLVFGREVDGRVVALCARTVAPLEPIAAAFGGRVVDWCAKD